MFYNPFNTPITTSNLKAEDAVDLFSDVFTEFHILLNVGHTFLNGARGSGKTMMFRLMQPDCRQILKKCEVKNLDFIGIYIGVKDAKFDKTEFVYLVKHAESIISEHYLTTNFSAIVFDQLSKLEFKYSAQDFEDLQIIYKKSFLGKLKESGLAVEEEIRKFKTVNEIFRDMSLRCINILQEFNLFSNDLLKNAKNHEINYTGIILKYSHFLFPLLEEIKTLKFMPENKPIFIMVDDADNLNKSQKQILNTWISSRSINTVSFKISTQLNYRNYRTVYGDRIETPHDFSEINIADRYTTSNRGFYKERIKDVIEKRLKKIGLKVTNPYYFFPQDEKQELIIGEIFKSYQEKKIKERKTSKEAYDFAYRYARPDYIRDSLKGNRNTYSYSGLDQLIHLSSGNMRQFIEPARNMYDRMITSRLNSVDSRQIQQIDSKVQDEEIRAYSRRSFVTYFDDLKLEKQDEIDSIESDPKIDTDVKESKKEEIKEAIFNLEKLSNLLNALGKLFNRILISSSSERRVFSIALNDEPDLELKKVLDLGVELGFLQEYAIGNKYGTGKSRLYILNRIIAPNFGLDPSSFAGYKFINSEILKRTLSSTLNFDNYLRVIGIEKVFGPEEPTLFSQTE